MKALFALNPFIWKYKRSLFLGLIFIILANYFGTFPAKVIRFAVDYVSELISVYKLNNGFSSQSAIRDSIVSVTIIFGLGVFLMALIRGVFLFFQRQTLIVSSRKVEFDLTNTMYNHLQTLPQEYFRMNRTGDLMARMTEDISRVRMYLGPGIMYTFNTFTLVIILLVAMFNVNVELTFYALIPLPILSISIYYVESIVNKKSDSIQKQLSQLNAFSQEVFRFVFIRNLVSEISYYENIMNYDGNISIFQNSFKGFEQNSIRRS